MRVRLFGAVLAGIAALVGVLVLFDSSRSKDAAPNEEPATSSITAIATALAPLRTGAGGRLTSLTPGSVTVVDGEGEHTLLVDADTEVIRALDHRLVIDKDLSRLQIGDSLWVVARADGHDLTAETITANGGAGARGIVASVDASSLEIRPLLSREQYLEHGAGEMRFLIDPAVEIVQTQPTRRTNLSVSDLAPGQFVWIEAYKADDGVRVALRLSISQVTQ